jgi:exopolysaccharide biosynthesis polyprenyl glycosylphosphotransferase
MADRSLETAKNVVLEFESGTNASARREFTELKERRQQKRQQVRQTSLSTHPSLFAFKAAWIGLDFFLSVAAVELARFGIGGVSSKVLNFHSLMRFGAPYALFVLAMAGLSGLYRTNTNSSSFVTLIQTLQATLPAGLGVSLLRELWSAHATPALIVVGQVALSIAGMFGARLIWRRHRDHLYESNIASKNFLIVGADEVGRDVLSYLSTLRHLGYRFRGFVSMCEPTDNLRVVGNDEIVGKIHDVVQLAQSRFVDEIIFSRRPATPGVLSRILHQAQPLGISIRLIPNLTETLIDRTDIEYVGDLPTIAVFLPRERPVALLVKRILDVSIASAALVLLFPLLLIIAIAIKLQSQGPVLYLSRRVGHKGRVFTCFKFRTMVLNAAAMQKSLEHKNERMGGAFFKISNDPRVTPVGRILRKFSLDELPQLGNVMRGDMSLVGPRPPLDTEAVQYDLEHLRRLDTVPGITGLWQVVARRDPSFETAVYLDRSYINNWSLMLDLKILLQTLKVVMQGTGC